MENTIHQKKLPALDRAIYGLPEDGPTMTDEIVKEHVDHLISEGDTESALYIANQCDVWWYKEEYITRIEAMIETEGPLVGGCASEVIG